MSSGLSSLIMIMESFSLLFLQEVSRAYDIDLSCSRRRCPGNRAIFKHVFIYLFMCIFVGGAVHAACDEADVILIDRCAVLTSAVVLFPSAVFLPCVVCFHPVSRFR